MKLERRTLPSMSSQVLRSLIAFSFSVLGTLLLTHSAAIALAISTLIGFGTFVTIRRFASRQEKMISDSWPEVIDHLVSGVQSGLSLVESIAGLGTRGPEILRPHFAKFRTDLESRGDFDSSINELRMTFADPAADQIFEAISISKSAGGAELLNILRTVGDFLRQDLALRKEIDVKHGWIKNSAHLSAAAPWLLLILLSTQPTTARAFSTATGVAILAVGIGLTVIAYLWMEKLAVLPQSPRVFKGN